MLTEKGKQELSWPRWDGGGQRNEENAKLAGIQRAMGHGCESRVGGRLGPDHAGPLRPRCFQAMGKPQKLGDKEEGVGICTLDHSGFQNVSVKEAQGSRMPTEVPGE